MEAESIRMRRRSSHSSPLLLSARVLSVPPDRKPMLCPTHSLPYHCLILPSSSPFKTSIFFAPINSSSSSFAKLSGPATFSMCRGMLNKLGRVNNVESLRSFLQ